MPLPNCGTRCIAKAKSTGVRCNNPAAYGCKTCRLHGARKNIISGKDHHWYKHGYRTKDGIEKAREIQQLLRVYEAIGLAEGFMHGKRTPGRKPK